MYLPKLSSGRNILSAAGYIQWVSLPSSYPEALGTVYHRSQVYDKPEHPQVHLCQAENSKTRGVLLNI